MYFRPYTSADHSVCLALLRTNVPAYIVPTEVEEYASWLDLECVPDAKEPCSYFVGLRDGTVVCAGGVSWAITAPVAILCWGIVHADFHRQGIGGALLRMRLDMIRARGGVREVLLDTTDAAVGFFLRHGFVVTGRVTNGYGAGVDRLDLALSLEDRSPGPAK